MQDGLRHRAQGTMADSPERHSVPLGFGDTVAGSANRKRTGRGMGAAREWGVRQRREPRAYLRKVSGAAIPADSPSHGDYWPTRAHFKSFFPALILLSPVGPGRRRRARRAAWRTTWSAPTAAGWPGARKRTPHALRRARRPPPARIEYQYRPWTYVCEFTLHKDGSVTVSFIDANRAEVPDKAQTAK